MDAKNIFRQRLLSSDELALGHGFPVVPAEDSKLMAFFVAHRAATEKISHGKDLLSFIAGGGTSKDGFRARQLAMQKQCSIYQMIADLIAEETGEPCVLLLTDLPEPKSYGRFDAGIVRLFNDAQSMFCTILGGTKETAEKYMSELGITGEPKLIYASAFSIGDPVI